MALEGLELEALIVATWPSDSPLDKCTRAVAQALVSSRHGPSGPFSGRASAIAIQARDLNISAWNALPKGLKSVVAHATPHIVVCNDPTCANPTNAGLRLLVRSLRSQSRPQLHRLEDGLPTATRDACADDSDIEDIVYAPPSLHTPGLTPAHSVRAVAREDELTEEGLPHAGALDQRLWALAAYPAPHRPQNLNTVEDNVRHLRCAAACFLLSPECAQGGPVGKYSASGSRISNVLRACVGQKWGAVGGRGSRLTLLADKALTLKPCPSCGDGAVALQLDLGEMRKKAVRNMASVLPSLTDAPSSGVAKTPIGAARPSPPGATSSRPVLQDPDWMPFRKIVKNALHALTHAAFPGAPPLNQLKREACVLLLQYSLAVHNQHPDRHEPLPAEVNKKPQTDPDGWQVATSKSRKHTPCHQVSLESITSAAFGFGAMPCTLLGSMLHKLMPQAYAQVPATKAGKRLKSIYNEVPCFIPFVGVRESETFLKLDVPRLATMGYASHDLAQQALTAIACLSGSSPPASDTAMPATVHGSTIHAHNSPTPGQGAVQFQPVTQQGDSLAPRMQQQLEQVEQEQHELGELPHAWQDFETLSSPGVPASAAVHGYQFNTAAHPPGSIAKPQPAAALTGFESTRSSIPYPPGFTPPPGVEPTGQDHEAAAEEDLLLLLCNGK